MARNPILIVPARLASTRLPDKPLADIAGEPMIVHVWRRAMEADIGPVAVACAEEAIAEVVRAVGGTAVLTRSDHPSGSDRIHEAVERLDPDGRHDAVVNVQGDVPTVAAVSTRAAFDLLRDPEVDIGTIAAIISRDSERLDPNVNKAVAELADGGHAGRALYFTKLPAPWGEGPLLHHIGLYAYRRAALRRFVAAPPSALERRERLEQLRALALGMRIDVALVDEVPLGVDTPEDLERARALLAR